MSSKESNFLNFDKLFRALEMRLPKFKGPWKFTKTPHGQSNPTFILTGSNGVLVVRCKPKGVLLKSAHMIEREFKVMEALYNTRVPVPKMYYLCEDPEEIGTPYYVMEFVEGKAYLDPSLPGFSAGSRASLYDQMNLGLANLHSVKIKSIGLEDFGKSGSYFARQLSIWGRQYELSKTEDIFEVDSLYDWLNKNLPLDQMADNLVHGDWRIDNLLFGNKNLSLSAVLDWEISTIGDGRADLANQLMQWAMPAGMEGRGLEGINRKEFGIPEDLEYIEKYTRRTGLLNLPDLRFPLAFCFFRMSAILQGVKKRALDGNASNPEMAIKVGKMIPEYSRRALKHLGL
tara:strand:+ start:869 stop:1900 length:1032 start_codon:yes stop_codon:yes gene_type:complete